ncbi:MAG: hypothetical protein MMC33_006161 [Icmadophila ericetorum]|nr:hypothetical protein [Icmadophila ericetorum]
MSWVWLRDGDRVPPRICAEDFGNEEPITIADDLAKDLRPYHMPEDSTLLRLLSTYFADAKNIAYISHTIILEFSEMSAEKWIELLERSPSSILNASVGLSHSNGPILKTELKRQKIPVATSLANAQEDDTNYVTSIGCFHPGAMLHAPSGDETSAGIAIQKGNQRRLTVPIHAWYNNESTMDFSETAEFKVSQASTAVGNIVAQIGKTDVGLMEFAGGIKFDNTFLDIPSSANTLVPFTEIRVMDNCLINNFLTGRQKVKSLGKRMVTEENVEKNLKRKKQNLPSPGKYIALRQEIYATNSAVINGDPKNVCGSAVIRVKKAILLGDRLGVGSICRFMHWSDLQLKYDEIGNLLCFADSVDPLIDDSWRVCQDPSI